MPEWLFRTPKFRTRFFSQDTWWVGVIIHGKVQKAASPTQPSVCNCQGIMSDCLLRCSRIHSNPVMPTALIGYLVDSHRIIQQPTVDIKWLRTC